MKVALSPSLVSTGSKVYSNSSRQLSQISVISAPPHPPPTQHIYKTLLLKGNKTKCILHQCRCLRCFVGRGTEDIEYETYSPHLPTHSELIYSKLTAQRVCKKAVNFTLFMTLSFRGRLKWKTHMWLSIKAATNLSNLIKWPLPFALIIIQM